MDDDVKIKAMTGFCVVFGVICVIAACVMYAVFV